MERTGALPVNIVRLPADLRQMKGLVELFARSRHWGWIVEIGKDERVIIFILTPIDL
jgi:hypothetical protein